MGPLSGTHEIVESKQESNGSHSEIPGLSKNDKDGKPPLVKLKCHSSLEDDLNQLFEAINLKSSSKELGLSRKNASKKPIGVSEISQPVTLKQALRGLCISQASEMAAMKRLAKSAGSSRVSEAETMKILYREGQFGKSRISLEESKRGMVDVSYSLKEITLNSSEKMPQNVQLTKLTSPGPSYCSSPNFPIATTVKGGSSIQDETIQETSKSELVKTETHTSVIPLSESNPFTMTMVKGTALAEDEPTEKTSKAEGVKDDEDISGISTSDYTTTEEIVELKKDKKASTVKPMRKGRVQIITSSSASTNGSSKLRKTTRNNLRLVKPVIRSKGLVKKKLKGELHSDPRVPNAYEGNESNLKRSTNQLLCQNCHCTLYNTNICAEISPNYSKPVVRANKNSKLTQKGELSQSSKSSNGEYSSSTSLSEESNLSGSSCGNRPHMSKDMKWEAIRCVQAQHGSLGLRHFNLLEKLGCGDIGTVYLAELIGTNCLFALKVMDNEYLARRKKMPRAQTEREILRMLDHPFLPTLYAQFTSDNLSCLVMEYCPYGDLHVLRQKQHGRTFPEQAARFYVAEVLLALEYLHMLGVVYRDLKPENILVRADGHIMLTDFDLSLRCTVNPTLLKSRPSFDDPAYRISTSGPCAGSSCVDPFCIKPSCQVSCFTPRLLHSGPKSRRFKSDSSAHLRSLPQLVVEPTTARSNSFVGTHEYLAPEIIKGEGHGSAVDWWTYGIFLYELIYGKTPFKGCGNEETLANVVTQILKFPDSPIVSFQARDLIRGLLVKEPEYRLGSERGAAEIKRHPFFEGLNWALIRCAVPPELPDDRSCEVKQSKYFESNASTGEHLEFELF